MNCPRCSHENRDAARFCGECAAPLSAESSCPRCGSSNPGGQRFCDACAYPLAPSLRSEAERNPRDYTPKHLAERILAGQAAMESRSRGDGERKTITALFADLKGSTALIEDVDPEEARLVIDPALQIMMDAVHRYEGYVAQALGDGIFALFGAPIAHEDHPQRALYAALRMQEEMRRSSDRLRLSGSAPIQMRVGINTGEVVVRSIRKDDLHADYVPVGHSINLAARMEQMATPGSILITEHTRRLTEGYFELKPLGAAKIKGVEEPLNVYEVLGAGTLRTRLQISARRGFARFVGRRSEMDHLRQALEQAKAGHGQIVGVMGEPGVGKSRLFYEFRLTSQSECLVLEALSVSHGRASPYLPIIELLKNYFQISPEDDERTLREKVNGKVLTLDRRLEDTLPYLFALFGIGDPTSSLQHMDTAIRRRRTFDALTKLFLRESLNQPLMLVFEDLHWIDPETHGFLDTLSGRVASAELLLLVNYRPEYCHEWGQKSYYTQLGLAPLDKEEAQELLSFLLGSEVALEGLKDLILERTEGTPLFMEELVQTLAEEGALVGERGSYRLGHAPTELVISRTVQGVLAARIDRLETAEKGLLQQLSVIGREFSLGLVRGVVSQPEEELYPLLSSLQNKEFLYEQPAFLDVEYAFKHPLTQEVAYGTVLQDQRKALHERTAQAIEDLYGAGLEEHYSELAHHYGRSENTQKAVDYLQLTGQQAVERSANEEAIGHLTRALELLKTLPDTPDRIRQELDLLIALGAVSADAKGFAAPEVEEAYARAQELCQQVGETPQLFRVLSGLRLFYLGRGKLQKACELGEQLLHLAQSLQDPTLLLKAHHALGDTVYFLGELARARAHQERVIALYDPQQHRSLAFEQGYDLGMDALAHGAWILWYQGYPEQALKRSRESLSLGRELSHAYSLTHALNCAAWLHQHLREGGVVQERAEEAIALSTEHGFEQELAWGTLFRGWALAEQGRGEAGIAQMRQALATLLFPWFLALLAEVYGKVGQANEGLTLLAKTQTAAHGAGWHLAEAELHRLKGELTLQSEGPSKEARAAEAEACFQNAIDVARGQDAKSWELRAATSLARLWQQQGKQDEAHQLLSDTYGWFSEGFETADLKDASALLDEVAS